jgi:hypothetical protein
MYLAPKVQPNISLGQRPRNRVFERALKARLNNSGDRNPGGVVPFRTAGLIPRFQRLL